MLAKAHTLYKVPLRRSRQRCNQLVTGGDWARLLLLLLLQRVVSFELRASLFGEFNIGSVNINIDIIIDVDDKTNVFLQP